MSLVEEAPFPAALVLEGVEVATRILFDVEPGLEHAGELAVRGEILPLLGVPRLGPLAEGDDDALRVELFNGGPGREQARAQPCGPPELSEHRLADEGEPRRPTQAGAHLPREPRHSGDVEAGVTEASLLNFLGHAEHVQLS